MDDNTLERLTNDEMVIVQAYRSCVETYRDNLYHFALAAARASKEHSRKEAGLPAEVILLADPLRKYRR